MENWRFLTFTARHCARSLRRSASALFCRGLACAPFGVALGAKLASRASAAAIAPIVTRSALAFVASVGVLKDQRDEIVAAKLLRELPCLRLRQPHQRRLESEGQLRAEPDRLLQGEE